jgi:hypothetical protein
MFRKKDELEQHEDDLSSNLPEIFSRARITWNLRSKRCSSGRFLRFRRGPSLWRQARSIGFYKSSVSKKLFAPLGKIRPQVIVDVKQQRKK